MMWLKLEVRMKFLNKLCGSVPLDPNMIKPWLEARMPSARPENGRSVDVLAAEVQDTLGSIDEANKLVESRITLGFQRSSNDKEPGLIMRGGTIKAHLKDCSRIVTQMTTEKIKGERSLALRVINCVNVEDYWIRLWRGGKAILEADNFFDKAVHVMTMMGPRNALKKILFVEEAEMKFNLLILTKDKKPVVSVDELKAVFDYGSVHGYAGERGDGEGRYTYELKEPK